MKVFFDTKHNEWCATKTNGTINDTAWGKTKEEAINRLQEMVKRIEEINSL